ncbi:type II toxin-antitoxin system RelE/ParE family toxin [Croceimicrobium hydrocarbonivorans]|uniref:Toxin n=1 Tax=Croceimicrobium hydrocarbonivorans TaxID=2761580 RepID=A0A7H0VFR8_9FLAO|nr:type II toxin-antitoxin system RelE/ParE family toxin [Croceimicrobium hydrocarbonivorans]QNR24566.1 type II toxin-antitoxin system RelE/ParE family toxin [Croceimicrobium hydrocarbonivorans]
MKFILSKESLNDLEEIWLYTFNEWSLEQANRYSNLILDEIEFIANHPESGEDYSHVRECYFKARIKSHFIFYKINPKKAELEIIRILHQRMDLENRL